MKGKISALLLCLAVLTPSFCRGNGLPRAVDGDELSRNTILAAVPGSEANRVDGFSAPATDFELGIGDVIHVSVWREQELTQNAVVRPDGKVSLPLAGEIEVAGKTAVATQALIRERLRQFIVDPQVAVSVLEIHSRQVFITGQVQRPGAYPLLGSVNILQLIASAGGLTPFAHRKDIIVLDTGNRVLTRFNYQSAIKGKAKQLQQLHPGDTVVIP